MTEGVGGAFLFFFPQLLLMLWALTLAEQVWSRRTLTSLFLGSLVLSGLVVQLVDISIEERLLFVVLLSVAWAVVPVMIFPTMQTRSPSSVERLIDVQQLWLRMYFLTFIRDNAVNVQHYELASYLGLPLAGVAGFVLFLGIVLFRRGGWVPVVRAVISLFLMAMSLDVSGVPGDILRILIILIGSAGLFSFKNAPFLIRRLNAAAIGGGLFLALLALADQAFSRETVLLASWVTIIFALGIFSWIQIMPRSRAVGTEGKGAPAIALMLFHIGIQTSLLVFAWPRVFSILGVVP